MILTRTVSWLMALVALGWLAPTVSAQPPLEVKNGKVQVKLELSMTDAPTPASQFYFLPRMVDQFEGNRVQGFLRCFMEQDRYFGREESERREKLLALPLSELPKGPELEGGRLIERDLYDAGRMSRIDWQLTYFLRRDGIATLLPDLQKFRQLANVMQLRLRGEIARGMFPEALKTLKTMYALAETTYQHPTMIGLLVAMAIESIAQNCLEEMLAQPNCPNYYWSLADLGNLGDMKYAYQGERFLISEQFPELSKPTGALSEARLRAIIDEWTQIQYYGKEDTQNKSFLEKMVSSPRAKLAIASDNPRKQTAAKIRLKGMGISKEMLDSLPTLQVAMMDELQQFNQFRDEQFKWYSLPAYQSLAGLAKLDDEISRRKVEFVLNPFLWLTTANIVRVRTRVIQRRLLLQTIEAIRHHALLNEGKLPKSLEELAWPAPLDPMSGKPFVYSLENGVAKLTGVVARPDQPQQNREYLLSIRK